MNHAHLCMSCPPAYLACSRAIPPRIHQYLSTLNKNGDIKNEVEKLFFRSTENKSQSIVICISGYCEFAKESVSMLCSTALWDTIASLIVI